jgi:hypothetical protein
MCGWRFEHGEGFVNEGNLKRKVHEKGDASS